MEQYGTECGTYGTKWRRTCECGVCLLKERDRQNMELTALWMKWHGRTDEQMDWGQVAVDASSLCNRLDNAPYVVASLQRFYAALETEHPRTIPELEQITLF